MENKTQIIIDWDDTLFPTYWLLTNNFILLSSKKNTIFELRHLDKLLEKFFEKLLTLGNIIIITNASIGWVFESVNYLPRFKNILKNIKIISAKKFTNNNLTERKKIAFLKEINLDKYSNIVSIGDAEHEYLASINLYLSQKAKQKKIYIKTIKLKEKPTLMTLINQILIIKNSIEKIVNVNKNLDLVFKFSNK